MLKNLVLAFCLVLPLGVVADVELRSDHPDRYVVKKGDTLWDIAGRFLRNPWNWPHIWYANPQIDNPHLIYPGDVLVLVYDEEGKPRLKLERGLPVVKLSPKARVEPLRKAVPAIPLEAIGPFLTHPLMTEPGALDGAPYVMQGADEHVITGAGDRVYVRGIADSSVTEYSVVRPGRNYVDPDSGELLGQEALYIGTARLERAGDPASLRLVSTQREVLVGDRLVPADPRGGEEAFQPHAPGETVNGRIIAVMEGVTQIGQHQVVVLSVGEAEGIQRGHVLAVYRAGAQVVDPVSEERELVRLPDERAGEVMVFRTFDRVSYALVMRAERAMHLHDAVRNP